MQRPHPAAVLFDMDGLLIDSERVAIAAMDVAAAHIDWIVPQAVGQKLIGLGRDGGRVVLRDALGEAFPLEAFWQAWQSEYLARVAEGVSAKSGALDALVALRGAGIQAAVATSTHTPHALLKLEKAGLLAYFGAVVGREAVPNGKPAPDLYLEAARRLRVDAAHCWAFEDSLPGLTAATRSGAKTHWVPDIAEVAHGDLPIGVERIDSLHEITRWIG
ncbi:MAG: HAD family phosphatase [Betaproteobacteria bacterium]|nr:MAG: HAD family phosphatase [Betaproteobacteria bacterium]